MDRILDLGLSEAREKEISLDEETRKLLEEREKARKERNFKRADEIRALLLAKGIEVQDSPTGPKCTVCRWSKRIKGCNIGW